MESLKVQSVVCLVPHKLGIGSSNAQRFIASPSKDKFKLFLNDGEEELSWTVDQCTTPDMNEPAMEERKKLINYALKGYNASALILSQSESSNIYQQRKDDMDLFLQLLSDSIQQSTSSLLVEYAYIGLTDDCTYDLRTRTELKNEAMLGKGYDSMLNKVDDINRVWNKIKNGSRIPFMLYFKITDSITLKQGHLQIIDLLQPPFASPASLDTPDRFTLHESFSQLVDIVNSITARTTDDDDGQPFTGHLNTDYYVLTDLLSKSLCGQEKTSIFAYFNDRIEDNYLNMVISCMDFLTSMSRIKINMMPNTPLTKLLDYKKLKVKNAELLSKLTKVSEANKSKKTLLEIRDKQIYFLQAAYTELSHAPSMETHKLRTELAYAQGVSSIAKLGISELQLEMRFLKEENDNLRASNKRYERRIAEELGGTADEIKRLKEKVKIGQQLVLEYENQIEQLQNEVRLQSNTDPNLHRRYKDEFTEKYNNMYAEFKKKLKNIKAANKEREARLKRQYQDELAEAKQALQDKKQDGQVENLKSVNHHLNLKIVDSNKTILELKNRVRKLEELLEKKSKEAKTKKNKREVTPAQMEEDEKDLPPTLDELPDNKQPSPAISRRRKIQHVSEDEEIDEENDMDDIDFVKPLRTTRSTKQKAQEDSDTDNRASAKPTPKPRKSSRKANEKKEQKVQQTLEKSLSRRTPTEDEAALVRRIRATRAAETDDMQVEANSFIFEDEDENEQIDVTAIDEPVNTAEADDNVDKKSSDAANVDEMVENMDDDVPQKDSVKEEKVKAEPSERLATEEPQKSPARPKSTRNRKRKVEPVINDDDDFEPPAEPTIEEDDDFNPLAEPKADDEDDFEPPIKPQAKGKKSTKKSGSITAEEAREEERRVIEMIRKRERAAPETKKKQTAGTRKSQKRVASPSPTIPENITEEVSTQPQAVDDSVSSRPASPTPAPQRKRRKLKPQKGTKTKLFLTDSAALSPLSSLLEEKGIGPNTRQRNKH